MRRQAQATLVGSTTRRVLDRGRFGIAFACLVVLCAFLGSSAPASAAVPPKAVTGWFGSEGAGQMSFPQGVGVNQATGDVYAVDLGNQRIAVFDADGDFLRAFGQNVVASGPGDNGTGYEICVPADGDVCKSGSTGSTGGAFSSPSGVAIDQSTGNLYVSDRENLRVQQFDADGDFLRAFGQNVVASGPGDSGTGFEVCVAADGDVCQAGEGASTGGAFGYFFNGGPAVAPSGAPNAGNVLVADPANLRIQEFTAAGAFVRAFGFDVVASGPGDSGTGFEACVAADGDVCKAGEAGGGAGQFTASVGRVAEDSAGNVYTVESQEPNLRVQKFTLPGNVVTPGGNFSDANLKGTAYNDGPFDVAIDPGTGNVLVAKSFAPGATAECPNTGAPSQAEARIVEVSSSGALEATHMACAGISAAGLGVRSSAATGDIFVSSFSPTARIFVLNVPSSPSVTLTAISNVGAHQATVTGFANPNGISTSYRVEFKRATDSTWASTVGSEIGSGTSNVFIEKTLKALDAGTTYEVRLAATRQFAGGTATTPSFTFTTAAAAPSITNPVVSTAATETGARAAFYGTVNPNGKATTYRFEYGTDTSYGSSVPVGGEAIGSGSSSLPVDDYVTDLEANTTYHFRLVAQSVSGKTTSPDQTVTTPPLEEGLPNGRVAELVTPADKRPTGNADNIVFNQLYFQAAESGDEMAYLILNGVEGSTTGGEVVYAADRAAEGWSPKQVTPAALVPPPVAGQDTLGRSGVVRYFSPEDLKCGIVETHNPLTDDTPQADIENGVYNLYRWNAADDSYTLLTNRIPLNPSATEFLNIYYEVIGATDDCSKIFFRSKTYKFLAGASGIYEWDNGVLREAGSLPDGSLAQPEGFEPPAEEAGLAKNNVSPDGRFYFSSTSTEGANSGKKAIFMREGPGQVIDVTQPTHGPTTGAGFETVSPDGSKVFFLANYGIAKESSAGPTDGDCTRIENLSENPCDLYAYDVDSGVLEDVSADPNLADPNGAVVQGVLAVSDDGSSVYFAARGQLVPGQGRTYSKNLEEGSANVYLSRDGDFTYVGGLQNDFQFGAPFIHNPSGWSSQTTENGDYLLFPSRDNMTATNPAGIQQAYLFSAKTGATICVSCPLDGSQPHDRNLIGGGSNAAILSQQAAFNKYTPRSLSEDGTVVFGTEDALTPGSVEGQSIGVGTILNKDPLETNVYEWRQGQVSLLATGQVEPIDMGGPDGRDIFIKTYEQLIPNDFDFNADIYDLRAGGGFPAPPIPPTPCDPAADQCQGTPSVPPAASNPASSQLNGPGNPPVQESKKKKKKHKKKHKKKKKKQHRNKQAARAAGANTGGAK